MNRNSKTELIEQQGEPAISHDHHRDGIDRRGFLKCMAWVGAGTFCVVQGGVLNSYSLGALPSHLHREKSQLSFVQISDSHMGFSKPANPDVVETFKLAIDKINALPVAPEFLLHTGDISHLSKPSEFDTVDQLLKTANVKQVFFVPGEHDVLNDDGAQYLERYGKGTQGKGWHSFDANGVHFVGLVNVMNLKAGGLGSFGAGAVGVAREGRQARLAQHAGRGLCPYSSMDGVSRVGLGHG